MLKRRHSLNPAPGAVTLLLKAAKDSAGSDAATLKDLEEGDIKQKFAELDELDCVLSMARVDMHQTIDVWRRIV